MRVLEAANGKPIIFMPARHDHHRIQTGDGYAAYVAGRLIGAAGRRDDRRAGVLVGRQGRRHRAARADRGVRRQHGARRDEVRGVGAGRPQRVVLVDFENDSVRTALEVARALGPRLWGVRLDTSGRSSTARSGTRWATSTRRRQRAARPQGARRARPRRVRAREDRRLRAASTGEKIREFEARGVPVDAYGVGSSLIRGANDFTADIVVTDGRPSAKVGRALRPERAARARRLMPGLPLPPHFDPGCVSEVWSGGTRSARPTRSGEVARARPRRSRLGGRSPTRRRETIDRRGAVLEAA